VIDPPGAGFSVGIDPPSNNGCIFRRITIINNRVIRTKRGGYGVRIGTPNNSKPTTGNVFEDIVIEGNLFRVEATASQPDEMIFTNTSDKAGIVFERLIVTGNTIENDGPTNKGYGIALRHVRNSRVTNNTVKGVGNGISLSGNLLSNEIRNNIVSASATAYRLEDSQGGNKAVNNRIVGNSKQKWKLSKIKPSDSIAEWCHPKTQSRIVLIFALKDKIHPSHVKTGRNWLHFWMITTDSYRKSNGEPDGLRL
jgi:parallel beta-helix repeat protein